MTEPKKSTRRKRRPTRRGPKPAREVVAPPEEIQPEPAPPPVAEAALALPPDLSFSAPEIGFAARAATRAPEPERPLPVGRRAIFFDVENTSRVQHIARVIDYLAVDRLGRRTDFIAVGNWRVIGHDTARLLSSHGAQLLHSAPSVGVKDWSDLRIAVTAGVWLGTARPGDVMEIISDDRAFDAVGDVATGLGVAFRRLSYRALIGMPRAMPAPEPVVEERSESHGGGSGAGGRRRRGRRGGRGRSREAAPMAYSPPPPVQRVAAVSAPAAEPHTAPHDELLGVARDLINRSANSTTTLDALANALKSHGFARPPGSPRLITRLRRIRELAVSRAGQITLVEPGSAPPPSDEGPDEQPEQPEQVEQADVTSDAPEPYEASYEAPQPRRGEAPVGSYSYEDRRAAVEAAQAAMARGELPPAAESAPPEAEAAGAAAPAPGGGNRRRSRRGGRRRRGRHGAAAS